MLTPSPLPPAAAEHARALGPGRRRRSPSARWPGSSRPAPRSARPTSCPAAGLARTTVSAAVDELLDRGVLRLVGTRPTAGPRPPGRPARALPARRARAARRRRRARRAPGRRRPQPARAGPRARRPRRRATGPMRCSPPSSRSCARCGRTARPACRPRAVVIGLPGPVDGHLGIPVRPPIMPGWHAYPVVGAAAAARSAARRPGERRQPARARRGPGAARRPGRRCCSSRSAPGIGGGLVTGDGGLHHGADGAAGDIGHVRVRGGPDEPCVCGNVGCIEAVASAGADRPRASAREARPEASIADVRALLARGDPAARRGWCGRPPR